MPKRIVSILCLILLSSCNLPGAAATTQPATVEASATPQAATGVLTAAPQQPTVSESGPALESIIILQPGPNSSIYSPVTVQGQSRPTFEQNLVIAIYGEDGSLLAQQPTTLDSPMGEPGNFNVETPFTVDHEQPGRVSVFETSAMDGGIIHLSSVEVTLWLGMNVIAPPNLGLESIDIQSPLPMAEISGGSIQVNGYSDYYFESNLGLMLCGAFGSGSPNDLCGTEDNILASGNAIIDSPDMGQPGPFTGELTYSITEPTPARIVVFAASPRDGGWLHVSSIPILLSP
ncbi:MAG: Gmad2 immunoglobulin-like domain-containing protein [Chloroflexi bacterium]|nr:Gmad2 immunoglobulin-like domain-containing protein [Chloroflexota bacterium]